MDFIDLPAGMGDSAMLALVVGFISPLILNLLISAVWPRWVKALAAFGWSAIAGALTAWIAGAFDGLSILSTVLLVLVVSLTTYQNFWKQVAPNLQRGTAEKQELEARAAEAKVEAIADTATVKVINSGAIERAVVEEHDGPAPY